MRLPIDTSSITFLAVGAPLPVTDFETKQPRTDDNGAPLFSAHIVALSAGEAEVVAVKVGGDPGRFGQGTPLKVSGLTAQPWAMGDRSGIAFRADKIEPLSGSAKPS